MTTHKVKIVDGRIELPEEIIKTLNLREGDELVIKVVNQKLEISKKDKSWEAYLSFESKYEGVFERLA